MKDYLIWTKHGVGSFVPYATINHTNIEDDGPDMVVDIEHVVPNVPDHGSSGGNEGGRTNMIAEDAEFLEAMLRRHVKDASMFFMNGMEVLMKAVEEPLYDESKGCTMEFTTLRSVLKLLVCKARYGLSDAGFDAFLSISQTCFQKRTKCLLTHTMQRS